MKKKFQTLTIALTTLVLYNPGAMAADCPHLDGHYASKGEQTHYSFETRKSSATESLIDMKKWFEPGGSQAEAPADTIVTGKQLGEHDSRLEGKCEGGKLIVIKLEVLTGRTGVTHLDRAKTTRTYSLDQAKNLVVESSVELDDLDPINDKLTYSRVE